MQIRRKKYDDFKKFSDSAEVLFNKIANSDSGNEIFKRNYCLHIIPGGRNGGMNHRIVEVFYGHRPYDEEETFEGSKLLTEWGATLLYQRTDVGSVICTLGPAGTSYLHQPEDAIVLEYIDNPSELESKIVSHWRNFIAYMKCTSLDGHPSLRTKLRVYKLRNFHDIIVDEKLQGKKVISYLEILGRYVATVWLSGFLLFALTKCSDDKQLPILVESQRVLTRQLEYLQHIDQKQNINIQLLSKKINDAEEARNEALQQNKKSR